MRWRSIPNTAVSSNWPLAKAADVGLDASRLQDAVEFAALNESQWPRSFYYPDGRYVGIVEWNETGPWSEIVGPVVPRGAPAGVILKGGRTGADCALDHASPVAWRGHPGQDQPAPRPAHFRTELARQPTSARRAAPNS